MSILNYDTLVANGAHFEWRIVNGNTTLYENLISGKLSQVLYEQASVGNVMAKQLDFTYYKESISFDTTLPLQLQYRAVLDTDTSTWQDKGEYWIDNLEASPYSDKASVTAFDSLLKANATWLESGTFSATTDLAIVQGIASDIGVSIETDTLTALTNGPITISSVPSIGTNGTTSMEMLSYIGVKRGGNWIINSDNELELITLFDVRASVNIGDAVEDFDASPAEEITRVILWSGDNQYYKSPSGLTDAQWEALGGRVLEARDYLGGDQTEADALYTQFSGETYYPYTTNKAWVDPKYELGDTITIKDVTSIISNQTINLTALASCSLSAKGQDIANSSYPYVSLQQREIAQTKQSVASIQIQADGIQSTVTEISEDLSQTQTQVTQNSTGIQVLTQANNEQASYLEWDGTVPVLKIGVPNSDVHVEIEDDAFKVVDGANESVFGNGRLTTDVIKARDEAQIGDWAWVDEGSDGFSLIYMG